MLCKRHGNVRGCNEEITGPLYDALFRNGPFSLHRRKLPFGVGRSASGRRRSDGPSYVLPTARIPGCPYPVLVVTDQGGRTGDVAMQVLFEEADGSTTPWRVPNGVATPDDLKAAVYRAGHKGKKMVWFVGDEAGRLRDLLVRAWPQGRVQDMDSTDAGMVLKFESSWKVEPVHARAIAMLGFHLLLALYQARGDEPHFAQVRDVIRGVADPMDLVAVQVPVDAPVPVHRVRDERPEQHKHLALVYTSPTREVIADLRLFADPEGHSPWWRVLLDRSAPGQIPIAALALLYFSDGPREVGGRWLDGEIIGLRPDDDVVVVPAAETRSS